MPDNSGVMPDNSGVMFKVLIFAAHCGALSRLIFDFELSGVVAGLLLGCDSWVVVLPPNRGGEP